MNQPPFDSHYQIAIHERNLHRFQLRIGIMALAVFATFCGLFARFYQLQVLDHTYYSTRAEDNRIAFLPIVPNRGIIVDRNGVVLAQNYSAFTLEITPTQIDDLDALIDSLAQVVEITPKDRRLFNKMLAERKRFASIPIRSRLSDEEVARFSAQRYRFPGVEINARLFREYPLGKTAAHVLGYIGRVDDKDVEAIDAWETQFDRRGNYRGTEYFGKNGVERQYEFALHGTTGHEKVEVDVAGRALRSLERTPAISGDNLTLTLDTKLQEFVEQAFGERRGALVAIEPSTGGILALVSMPSYDPNLFVEGIRPDDYGALTNDPDIPLLNRAIKGTYPPGSTFKPFMALAALEYKVRTPEQAISDPGYFIFGNNRFRDDKVGGHGSVNMHKSIVVSCDTYYYHLANDLGIDRIAAFMKQLNFGQKTGIDIPGELEGILPSTEWKKRYFRTPEKQKWYAGETISIGIGQGYNSYTIMQLAQATAAVANNGVMYKPHLVHHISHLSTGEETLVEPKPMRELPLTQKNIDFIKNAMRAVNQYGTGARAFAKAGYDSAGKTGTAQVFSLRGAQQSSTAKLKEELRDHALFIAFAPVDQPKIALAVLVENAGFGARSAAPIVRQVLDYYLLGKLPEPDPPPAKPAAATEKPAATTEKPAAAAKKPAAATEKPAAVAEKPAAVAEKPAAVAEKPAAATKKPAATTEKPAATTEKPAATTEKPAATAKKPAATTEKPAATAKKPATTTEKPAATPAKPTTDRIDGRDTTATDPGSELQSSPIQPDEAKP